MSLTKVTYSMISGAPYNVADAGKTSAGIQTAVDSGQGSIYFEDGDYKFTAPVLIKSGTSRVSLFSNNRIRALLGTDALTTISTAPQNVNALFIIQDNNAHFCMENFYFPFPGAGYTGIGIYCVENGCADGSGQALFSGLLSNLFVNFPSTNTGFLVGGVQNCAFDTITFENIKTAFNLQGVGTADTFFRAISLYNCYDSLISQVADTNGAKYCTVEGVQAYSHLRGRLFDVQNWSNCKITDVFLSPDPSNLGDTGLFKFKNCTDIVVSNFQGGTDGTPLSVGIEIKGATRAKFSNGYIKATSGVLFSDTGSVDIEFENIDFTGCTNALRITDAVTGTIRTRNCKFNQCSGTAILHSVANTLEWISEGDEFLDAGFNGSSGTRIFDVDSDSNLYFYNPKFGKTLPASQAAVWINANGSGEVRFTNPLIIGAPSSGVSTGTQSLTVYGVSGTQLPTYGAVISLDTRFNNQFIVVPTNSSAYIIENPQFAASGMVITITVRNTTGGALGAMSFDTAFKASSWTQPANGFNRSITFRYNGTNWIEIGRTAADVPN